MTGLARPGAVKSSLWLLLAAMIWGFTFVAQRSGMEHLGPFAFNALRSPLGAAAIWAAVCLRRRRLVAPFPGLADRATWVGGLTAGVMLFLASTLQQTGLVFTTAGKGGFLTTMYIVLVPVIGLFLRQRPGWTVWLAVAMALVGMYLLTVSGKLSVNPGDVIVVSGAVFWAGHILVTDRYAPRADVPRMVLIQFVFLTLASGAAWPWADPMISPNAPSAAELWPAVWASLPALVFAGVLSSGVAYTAQALGQRGAPPAAAAIIMSLESVFAALGGAVVLHEALHGREWFGCALLLVAALMVSAPKPLPKRRPAG
jgi:drug/metabolite transporter (DMT)-like permease